MSSEVLLETPSFTELLRTEGTLEGPLSRVAAEVSSQLARGGELLAAHRALESFLPEVDPVVSLQVTLDSEHLAALLTLIRRGSRRTGV